MKNASKPLVLISSDLETRQDTMTVIDNLTERWRDAEKQLQTLQHLEEEYFENLDDKGVTSHSADHIFSQLDAIERIQSSLLQKLSNTPAENRRDVLSKLEIWKQIVMPDGNSSACAQPSDLLVSSVMGDILRVTDHEAIS